MVQGREDVVGVLCCGMQDLGGGDFSVFLPPTVLLFDIPMVIISMVIFSTPVKKMFDFSMFLFFYEHYFYL